ncbi:tetratricopeptide repeat protein [Rhodoferax sp. AJA081-3]|uniref:O-linked N-acetylglucosamine transferase, SPINDLY family protein n=1 Tax=Rhodoferax sp. AJA081-3 TaxID=2752316 RepID=UPI0021115D17|nr:tetratricopeptide repeat protein [Rhodoferax sp. AJA081-3]
MLDRLRLLLQRRLDTLTGRAAPPLSAQASNPVDTERLRKQGNAYLAEEKLEEAEACFREALAHTVDDTQSLVCLGYVLKEQGRLTEARITLKRAVNPANTDPQAFEAHYLLGEISEKQGDLHDANKYFKSTLDLRPDFTRACEDVVRLLVAQGRKGEARAFLEERIVSCPESTDYRVMLAKECTDSLDLEGTVQHLTAAVAMGVKDPNIEMLIGASLCRLEREIEARPYFDSAVATNQSFLHEALYHRGYYFTRCGNARAGIELLEQSIASKPDYQPAHSLILLNLSHSAEALNRSYQQAAERFSQNIEGSIQQLPPIPVELTAVKDKVLRVGFVAGEFREHPVLHFLVGILEHISKDRFHLVAFSNNQKDDAGTEVFRALFSGWHDIKNMGHDTVAELIRTERIDILIDLSGHTGDARLPVFARKPAPVQVAWLGYFASTGLKAMDYIIADTACVPEHTQEWFSEKVFRLPATRLCMTAPRTSRPIPIKQAPCCTHGYVTFGSFQQLAKINTEVLGVWAKVLGAVPHSRLKIQNMAMILPAMREQISADMVSAGIDLSRVELVGGTGWESYLDAHNGVDIALDTFPYPGGTTTAFALWMGVPTITLAGNTMLSLQGAAMLGCVGLGDWVAKNEAEYVEIARKFASNVDQLAKLKDGLRAVAEQSPLFDTKTFAINLQNALEAMYREKMASLVNASPQNATLP